jgi:isoleucyl-tRNA synthetase
VQITIKREMKELEGETASHTDGEVIILFDLRSDSALLTKRTARELVNRFQKLRKKAGLLATDTVELFYAPRAAPKGSFFFKLTSKLLETFSFRFIARKT